VEIEVEVEVAGFVGWWAAVMMGKISAAVEGLVWLVVVRIRWHLFSQRPRKAEVVGWWRNVVRVLKWRRRK
jgi:hypothetical protein